MTTAQKLIAPTLLLLIGISFHSQPALAWPGQKKAAIVLTYDDALTSQLDVAIPQLNREKLKGTFFLDARMTEREIERWRVASRQGHELGNHTLFHPCSSNVLKGDARYALENYSVDAILREISVMNRFLFAIDRQPAGRSYSYSCSEHLAGNADYTDPLRRSGLVLYARSGGDRHSVITDLKRLDPYRVPSWGFDHRPGGAELIDFVERVRQAGGMGVFMFHGVGGDYLEVSAAAHAQLLEYLREHKDEVWVGTFREVMDYVTKKK